MLDFFESFAIIHPVDAGVAHPVERHLAKVEVASSSLVTRSKKRSNFCLPKVTSFFIQAAYLGISSRFSVYIIAARRISSPKVYPLRLDDIPQQVADDIQGLRLDLFVKVCYNGSRI